MYVRLLHLILLMTAIRNMNSILGLYDLILEMETSFRDLKHTIGTENFHSKSGVFCTLGR